MIKTESFEFDRKGQITFFVPTDYIRVLKMCVLHARIKKTKKPSHWRMIPTLTDAL